MHKLLPILFMAAVLIASAAGNASAGFTVESGETFTLSANETLTVDGNLTIAATGTLDASVAGTTISLSGNWTNNGTFTPGSSTVTFTGAGTSVINGSNTFYNFTCVTASKQLTFEAGSTQTISNTLTLNGQASGTKIVLRSSTSGTRWTFDVTGGAQSVDYVDVKDSSVSSNDITANNSTGNPSDSGNNDDTESSPYWVFGAAASDDDDDGITKEDEEAGPNSGDSNGDGIADYTQSNVAIVPDEPATSSITLQSFDDDGNDTATAPDITSIVAVPESIINPSVSVDFPFGLLDFDLTLNGGETQSVVTLYWHGIEDLTGYTFYHFNGTTNAYTAVTGVTLGTASIGGTTVATATFTLVDGGQGDESGVNGVINDPVGPGFPSGGVRVVKNANKQSVVVGDVITYTITIGNTNAIPVPGLFLEDKIPPGFKYIRGRSILDNQPITDPAGNRPLVFNIGTVAVGETKTLKYQLVVGSGVTYGSDYENSAFARYSDGIVVSNVATESVNVVADPLFDLGTTIGKVFHDRNGNGVQDPPHTVNGELIIEEPIGNVQIFTEDGTVITN